MIVGLSEQSDFPILLEVNYGAGAMYIWTIPENFGDLYHLPDEVLNRLRQIITGDLELWIEGPAKVGVFLYDNDAFIVESFLPYFSDARVALNKPQKELVDPVSGEKITGRSDRLHHQDGARNLPGSPWLMEHCWKRLHVTYGILLGPKFES